MPVWNTIWKYYAGVFTNLIKIDLNYQGGSLQANYTLDLDTNLASENEIIITVKEA